MDTFTIPKIFDAHVHFRRGPMLNMAAPITAGYCQYTVVMPNPIPPVLVAKDVEDYKDEIDCATGSPKNFHPLMTFQIVPETDPKSIEILAQIPNLVSGKVYPKELTTNSENGVVDFLALRDVYLAMQKHDVVLCLHGEMPGDHIIGRDREHAFLRTLRFLAKTYPDLRIVLEHITTAEAVETVLSLPPKVVATITVHHLLLTSDDVGGDRMCPNNYCKPIAKDPKDREALLEAATSGCPKFFFGSDSAPHLRAGKQKLEDCCAGIFSAPVAPELLVEIFEERGALDRLLLFAGEIGRRFYRRFGPDFEPPDQLNMVKKPWTVPDEIEGVVPFMANRKISWQVDSITRTSVK